MKKKKRRKLNVLFSKGYDGKWYRREWSEQCPEEVFMHDQCQGVKGHKGVHWCYTPCGDLAWDRNEDFPDPALKNIAAGTIPAGHKTYISPAKKQVEYWLSHYTDSVVTNPREIARLNAGRLKDGEALTQPIEL